MKKPNVKVGDELDFFDEQEDAESLQRMRLNIKGKMPICWHFVAQDADTGIWYSLFMQSNGETWRKAFENQPDPPQEGDVE